MCQNISFVHISDTHIGEDDTFSLWGKNTIECSRALVDHIRSCDAPVDFAVHTGDVIHGAPNTSFARAEKLFSSLPFPVFFIQGNHDGGTAGFKRFASSVNESVTFLDEVSSSYSFRIKGRAFLALDCRGPADDDPQGLYTERHEEIVARFLEKAEQSFLVVFIHFPVLPLDSRWIDRGMLLRNGEKLHARLRAREGGRCVFFGHVHRRISALRDGILYSSAPSPFCQFSAGPADETPVFEPDIPVSFDYVTLTPSAVIVKEMTPGGRAA